MLKLYGPPPLKATHSVPSNHLAISRRTDMPPGFGENPGAFHFFWGASFNPSVCLHQFLDALKSLRMRKVDLDLTHKYVKALA